MSDAVARMLGVEPGAGLPDQCEEKAFQRMIGLLDATRLEKNDVRKLRLCVGHAYAAAEWDASERAFKPPRPFRTHRNQILHPIAGIIDNVHSFRAHLEKLREACFLLGHLDRELETEMDSQVPKMRAALDEIAKIGERWQKRFEELIPGDYASYAYVTELINGLMLFWLKCGKPLQFSANSPLDQYLCAGYEAAYRHGPTESLNLWSIARKYVAAHPVSDSDRAAG